MSEATIQNDLDIKNLSDSNLIIAGVGASAGGLEALQDFFTAMPAQIPFAFVVIQHLSPDYKSLMDELLARCTNIKIDIASDGMPMEANHIYLIPPGKNISVYHDKLYLDSQNHKKSLNLPIDIFFRSLAKDKGSKAIGIVLSGTGSDGTMGIKAIKEAGGMVMVQEESTARFDGMPRSAIATGLVDFILPPSKMPEALEHFIKHPLMRTSLEPNILTQNIDELSKVALILRDHTGVDFSFYKENTFVRRLERRISINRMDSLSDYVVFLNESNKEKDTLYRELLIGVTRFFRDNEAFESLEKNIFPKIDFKHKKTIRIWSTGCSTGEEVYSLAILIKEYMERYDYNNEIKIFATDIDKFALDQANTGFYTDGVVSDLDPVLLVKYFNKRENGYQVHESIRKMVVFATHNLLKDPPFSKLDLLVCRNLFIYIKPEIQKKILSSFYYSLYPDGFLFLGSSETLGNLHEAYESVDSKWKIYKVKSTFRPSMIKDMPAPVYYSNDNKSVLLSQLRDGKGKKFEVFAEQLLSNIAPPSVLLDEEDNIIHIINDVNRFISMKPGKFSMNLYHHLHPDLNVIVSSLLFKLKKESQLVVTQNVTGLEGLEDTNVTIEAKRILIDNVYYNLLVFNESSAHTISGDQAFAINTFDESDTKRYKELQAELQFTKENLQATVEELETSNEELQSSNEELIASNEELQSTNEELQSVNEELFTVNYEYQSKIEELTKINTDIHNLLKHTEVGALYLDSMLCIRKFTPLVAGITNIMPSDIGRPITHISTVAIYPEMSEDIQKVSDDLQAIEKEVTTTDHKNFMVKILPYRTETNAIDGILLTFTEISKLKDEKNKNSLMAQRLQDALEMGRMAWWEWDATTGKVTMDEKKATMIGYTLQEFPDNIEGICALIHPDDYEETMQIMRDHLSGKKPEWLATYRIKRKDGTYGWYYDRGMITHRDAEGKPLKLMGTVIEVSHLKQMEQENLWFKQLYAKTIDYLDTPLMVYNHNGVVVAVNESYANLLQTDKSSLEGLSFNQSIEKFYSGKLKLKPEQHPFAVAKNTVQKVHVENIHIHLKNQIIRVILHGTPMVDINGNLQAVMIEIKTPK